MKLKDIFEDITPQELYTVERFADNLWSKYGVDVQFTKHFMDRVNDPRNQPPIYVDDLIDMFRKEYQQQGQHIAQLPDQAQSVMRDLITKLNLPFVIASGYRGKQMIVKTAMRKKNFQTSNPVFAVEHVIDNDSGPGTTPNNREIDYFGAVVHMKPSTFLKLASPLEGEPSVTFFRERIRNGEGFGAPMLYIGVPDGWKAGNFDGKTMVKGHEGRNRMTAIMQEEGDVPVETHILLSSKHVEWRARNISTQPMQLLDKGCYRETTGSWVTGPLFVDG